MKIALLADIHGNLQAFEAVITRLEGLQPDQVVVDGDLINALPYSAEVLDSVRKRDWIVLRGNHEFYYLDFGTERARPGMDDPDRWGQLHWLAERITSEQADYMASLPDDLTLYFAKTQPLRVAHGVPGRNRVGFYNEQSEKAISAEIEMVLEKTLISAHTHVQVDRHVSMAHKEEEDLLANPHGNRRNLTGGHSRSWHIVNPGSVGLPLNGDPGAQFAMIESVPQHKSPGGWIATHYSVPYDRRPILEAFSTTGMLDAGGVITELFYWEVVMASPEIIRFYQWSRSNGHEPDEDLDSAFAAYVAETGRREFVRKHDPLYAEP